MTRPLIVVFDFGETLARYGGVGLDWSAHYDAALSQVAARLALRLSAQQLEDAKQVLSRYNTRQVPREREVDGCTVFAEVLAAWQPEASELVEAAIDEFFGFFRRTLHVYPDTLPALATSCEDLVYVGNEPKDVEAASRAGCIPLFLDRDRAASSATHVPTLHSLDELQAELSRMGAR